MVEAAAVRPLKTAGCSIQDDRLTVVLNGGTNRAPERVLLANAQRR